MDTLKSLLISVVAAVATTSCWYVMSNFVSTDDDPADRIADAFEDLVVLNMPDEKE